MSNKEAATKLVELLASYARTCVLPADAEKYTEAVAIACAALGGNNG